MKMTMNNIARLVLAIVGVVAIAWVIAVFPVFWSEKVIIDVAGEVINGNIFKPEILAAVEAQTETNSGPMRRSSVLGKAAVIRLRQAEDAIRAGDPEMQDQKLESLGRIVDKTFLNAPSDPFLWLVRFWLDSTRNGLRPENLRFLRMSYDLGPYEGWIAVKRNRIALAAYSALPSDLTEQAISEFVGLVRWGFVPDAGAIAAGPGRPLRGVLFPRLKDLNYEQRRAFANVIYGRELDDVPVPGIAPPTPQIPMPVLPPGF
jgi:hypothetical protein